MRTLPRLGAPTVLLFAFVALAALLAAWPGAGWAHDISKANAAFVERISGPAPVPFLYLGAKHMVTGIDHVLFLLGVVFYLHRLRDVALYVSMFTIGHSITLLGGVLLHAGLNSQISAASVASALRWIRG
jgi:hypothetical protein